MGRLNGQWTGQTLISSLSAGELPPSGLQTLGGGSNLLMTSESPLINGRAREDLWVEWGDPGCWWDTSFESGVVVAFHTGAPDWMIVPGILKKNQHGRVNLTSVPSQGGTYYL